MDYYGKIEDPTGLPNNVQEILTTNLISGKAITFPAWLQGGGQVHKKYFLKVLADKKYKNAFEWCAGHGEIGFELLTAGVCNTLAFSDMHPKSAEWCLKNAESLGVTERVSAYVSSTIKEIPASVKWDLVVGNPPNAMSPDPFVIKSAKADNWSEDHIILFARTTWDSDFKTHKEFFKNIGDRTTDDVDIFISVNNTLIPSLETIANQNRFKVESITDMFPDPYPEFQTEDLIPATDPQLKVVHFKKI